ncbi:MAG: hypothetical protein IPO54_05630 [Micavibrio sp.]|nr:hypothetical protein [Micavibrio sp.]
MFAQAKKKEFQDFARTYHLFDFFYLLVFDLQAITRFYVVVTALGGDLVFNFPEIFSYRFGDYGYHEPLPGFLPGKNRCMSVIDAECQMG